MSGPKHDAPFRTEFMEYLVSRLRAVGLEPDKVWLAPIKSRPWSAVLLDAHKGLLDHARQNIPKGDADWELAEFYRGAIPNAVFDLSNGPIETFAEFAFLYERMLGADAAKWFASLYLAACSAPRIVAEQRITLVSSFDVDALTDP